MKLNVKKLCPRGTKIQSIIFDKDAFSKNEARDWAKKHDMTSSYVDEKENTYRIRQYEPESFKKGTFRTIKLTDGVQAVIGCPVSDKFDDGGGLQQFRKGGGIKDLVVLHNINGYQILEANKLGGLVTPSIAIVKAGESFTDFGSISLIGTKDLIDPENRSVKVFAGDVYSPSVPRKLYYVDTKKLNNVVQRLVQKAYSYEKNISISDRQIVDMVQRVIGDYSEFERDLNRFSFGELVSYYDEKLRIVYVVDKDIPVKVPMREKRYFLWNNMQFTLTDEQKKRFKPILKQYSDESNERGSGGITQETKNKTYDLLLEALENIKNDIKTKYADNQDLSDAMLDGLDSSFEKWVGTRDGFSGMAIHKLSDAVYGEYELDKNRFESNLKRIFTKSVKKDYESWLSQFLSQFRGSAYFLKGQQKVPYTLSELVDATSNKVIGQEKNLTFGVNQAKSYGTKQLKSIDEIKKNSGVLISKEQMNDVDEKNKQAFFSLSERLKYEYTDTWGKLDSLGRALADYFKGMSAATALRKNDFKVTDQYDLELFKEFASELKNSPVDYFEAKYQRAVSLSEFKYAVVPQDTDKEVIDILKNNGLSVKKYSTTEQRIALVNAIVEKDKSLKFKDGGMNTQSFYAGGGSVVGNYIPKTQSELIPLPSSISYTMFSGQENFSRDVNEAGYLFVDISQNTKTSYRINIQIGESRFSINQNVEGLKYIEKNEYSYGTGRNYTAYYLKPKTFMDFVYHIEKVLERALPEINLNGLVLKFYRRWFLDNIISNTPSTEQAKIFSPKRAVAPVQQPESTEQVTAEVTEQVQQSSQTETVSGYPLEYLQQKFREKESIQRNFRKPDNWNTTYDIWEELTIKGRKNFLKWAAGDDNSIGKGVVLDEAQADAIANTDYRNADLSLLTKAQVVAWIFFTKYAISKGDVKKWNSEPMPQFAATQQVEEQVEDEVKQEVETDKSTPDKEVKYARLTLKQVRDKYDNADSTYQAINRYIKWHENKQVLIPLGIEKNFLIESLPSLKEYKRKIYDVWSEMREKDVSTISESKIQFVFNDWTKFNLSKIILRAKYIINFSYLNNTNTVDGKFYSGSEITSMEKQIEDSLGELCRITDNYPEYYEYMKTITDKKAEGRDYAYVLAQYGEDKYSTVVLALTDYMQGQENRWSGYNIIYRTDVEQNLTKEIVSEQVSQVQASANQIKEVIDGLMRQIKYDPENPIYQEVIDGLKIQLRLMGESYDTPKFQHGAEVLIGGAGDNLTLEEIADKHGVELKQILREAVIGRKIEREHTSNQAEIEEIVKDHLMKDSPEYYSKLLEMEKTFESGGIISVPSMYHKAFQLKILMSIRGASLNSGVLQGDGSYKYEFNNDMDLNTAAIELYKLSNPNYAANMPQNINQLKQYIQIGKLLRVSYNRFRPNRVGTINVVVKTQNNGFYLKDGSELPSEFNVRESIWFEYPKPNMVRFSPIGFTIFGMVQGDTQPVKTLEYEYVTGVQEDISRTVEVSDEELSKEAFERSKYLTYLMNAIDNVEGFFHGGRLTPSMIKNDFAHNLDKQTVSCFIKANDTGRILIVKRATGDYIGSWSLPSGHVDSGEMPQDAIKREIQEELNVNLNTDNLIYLDTTKHLHGTHFFYELFVKEEFEPVLNYENLSYMWVNFNDLPEDMHPLLMKYMKSSIFAE